MAEIRYHLDENVHHAVAHGLRLRGVDVTTTTDAGMIGAADPDQLEFAGTEGRVLVTHDEDLLVLHSQGIEHAGIAYCHPGVRSIGQMILKLVDLRRNRTAEEMRGQLEFL